MTLSLDDVRNKRFRMARKSGYEVLEVDEFVDEIEESFAQLLEENQNLKKQVEALKSSSPEQVAGEPDAEPAVAKTAEPVTPAPTPTPAAPPAPAAPTQAAETIVVTTAKEASTAVVRLVEMSTEQAERLVAEATADANRIREEATSSAHQVTSEAQTRAERLEAEARAEAEKVQAQTLSRSEQLEREINQRRTEMLDHLQSQREELSSSVQDLRAFEAAYRSNLTEHLRNQISAIESGKAEPQPVPELAAPTGASGRGSAAAAPTGSRQDEADTDTKVHTGGDAPRSDTPRLDALLGDQR